MLADMVLSGRFPPMTRLLSRRAGGRNDTRRLRFRGGLPSLDRIPDPASMAARQ
jgi:hypothetical protein